jgi:hypothetical protein
MSSGRLSSPAFGRGWRSAANSFYVSAFAEAVLAAGCFGSAATATGDSATAARCAANKPIGNSGVSPTVAINKVSRDDSIIGTVSASIADAELIPA